MSTTQAADEFTGTNSEKIEKLVVAVIDLRSSARAYLRVFWGIIAFVAPAVGYLIIQVQSNGVRIEVVAERLNGVEKRLDGRIEEVTKRMDGIEKRMDGIEKRMDGIEKRMDGIEKRQQETNDRLIRIEALLTKLADRSAGASK